MPSALFFRTSLTWNVCQVCSKEHVAIETFDVGASKTAQSVQRRLAQLEEFEESGARDEEFSTFLNDIVLDDMNTYDLFKLAPQKRSLFEKSDAIKSKEMKEAKDAKDDKAKKRPSGGEDDNDDDVEIVGGGGGKKGRVSGSGSGKSTSAGGASAPVAAAAAPAPAPGAAAAAAAAATKAAKEATASASAAATAMTKVRPSALFCSALFSSHVSHMKCVSRWPMRSWRQ